MQSGSTAASDVVVWEWDYYGNTFGEDEGIDEEQIAAIRACLAQERALGDMRFQAMVEKTLNRPAQVRARGRPVKSDQQ